MAAALDPRKAINQIPVPLLIQLLQEFDFRQPELVMLVSGDKNVDVYESVMRSEPETKRRLLGILRQAFDIADDAGARVMAQDLVAVDSETSRDFQNQPSLIAKAMWFYLSRPGDFERVARFAAADRLAGGRSWKAFQSLPVRDVQFEDGLISRLKKNVSGYYHRTEGRGGQCEVVPYVRGDETDYFFVYMDDHPQSMMVFRDGENQPTTISERIAYENIFVHERKKGRLQIYARGGRRVVEALAKEFCSAAFGQHTPFTPATTRVYSLNHFLDPALTLQVNPAIGLAQARIRSIRLRGASPGEVLQYEAGSQYVPDAVPRMLKILRRSQIITNSTRVASVTFEVGLKCPGTDRGRVVSFSVTWPGWCSLLNMPDEDREIGEWCLKAWGVSQ